MMPKSEINDGKLMEDLARFYDSGYELVVGEIIGNALDIKSTKVDIQISNDVDGKYIEFHNNGKPMTKENFDIYHTLAKSTKTYGISLGWAGIGAKLYLGKKTDSKIITTSSNGATTIASEMFLKDEEKLWHEFIESDEKFYGTKYKTYLADDDYDVLNEHVHDLIRSMFNTAMINGLEVTADGKIVERWNPIIVKKEECVLKIKNRTISFSVWATADDIPVDRCNVEYQISGKRIVDRAPKNLLSVVKKEFRRKFYVTVDAMDVSDQLKTEKASFRPGIFTSEVEPGIEKKVLKILKDWGYLEEQTDSKTVQKRFTKIIEDLLKQLPELKMEGPLGSTMGSGKSRGKGTKTASSTTYAKNNLTNQKRKSKNPKSKGGLSVTTVDREDDHRQGWTQISTNEICVNIGHRAAKMVAKTVAGKEYHLLRVVCNELVKNAAKKVSMDVEKALEYSDILFDGLAKARTVNPRDDPWNFKKSKDAERDDDGRFLPK